MDSTRCCSEGEQTGTHDDQGRKRPTRWCKPIVLLVAFALSIGLWLFSSDISYRRFGPLVCAIRGPGALFQVCSREKALHILLVRQRHGA